MSCETVPLSKGFTLTNFSKMLDKFKQYIKKRISKHLEWVAKECKSPSKNYRIFFYLEAANVIIKAYSTICMCYTTILLAKSNLVRRSPFNPGNLIIFHSVQYHMLSGLYMCGI